MKARIGRSYGKIEEESRTLIRESLGLSPESYFPAEEIFENLDNFTVPWPLDPDIHIPLDWHVFERGTGNAGLTRYLPNEGIIEISLDEDCYLKLQQGDGHARFTVCHELAHAYLHTVEVFFDGLGGGSTFARSENYKIFYCTEWQANAAAGALLMPASILAQRPALSKQTISRECGVSHSAAETRIQKFEAHQSKMLPRSSPQMKRAQGCNLGLLSQKSP